MTGSSQYNMPLPVKKKGEVWLGARACGIFEFPPRTQAANHNSVMAHVLQGHFDVFGGDQGVVCLLQDPGLHHVKVETATAFGVILTQHVLQLRHKVAAQQRILFIKLPLQGRTVVKNTGIKRGCGVVPMRHPNLLYW